MPNWIGAVSRVAKCGLLQGKPSSLVYVNTMKCNARCKMCIQWRERQDAETSRRKELTLEQVDRFTRSMGPLLMVALSGGETFLRPDIGETMQVIGRNCRPLLLTVPTNGSSPERTASAVHDFCTSHPGTMLRLNVSVDAPGKAHDAIRGIQGLYEQCRETIARLKEVQKRCPNLTVNICTVLSYYTRENAHENISHILEELCPDHQIGRAHV